MQSRKCEQGDTQGSDNERRPKKRRSVGTGRLTGNSPEGLTGESAMRAATRAYAALKDRGSTFVRVLPEELERQP
jgi:hypothetical protein